MEEDDDFRLERLRGPDDFRGTVKMFSKSLKEASDSDNIGGRRVKLKRTVYQETAG